MRSLGVRFGTVGLQGEAEVPVVAAESTTLEMALGEEAEAFRSMQTAVQSGQGVPLIEAEAVVWSLAVAMHGQQRIVMPLLQLKEFDRVHHRALAQCVGAIHGAGRVSGLRCETGTGRRRCRPAA